jgi:hypothetical protein
MKMYLLLLSLFFCSLSFAQNSISGTVTDSDAQSVIRLTLKSLEMTPARLLTVKEIYFNVLSQLPYVLRFQVLGLFRLRLLLRQNQKVNVTLKMSELT